MPKPNKQGEGCSTRLRDAAETKHREIMEGRQASRGKKCQRHERQVCSKGMAGVNIRMIRSIQQKQAKLLDLALQDPRIGQDPSQILMIFLPGSEHARASQAPSGRVGQDKII